MKIEFAIWYISQFCNEVLCIINVTLNCLNLGNNIVYKFITQCFHFISTLQ